jgi:hypothetical protein
VCVIVILSYKMYFLFFSIFLLMKELTKSSKDLIKQLKSDLMYKKHMDILRNRLTFNFKFDIPKISGTKITIQKNAVFIPEFAFDRIPNLIPETMTKYKNLKENPIHLLKYYDYFEYNNLKIFYLKTTKDEIKKVLLDIIFVFYKKYDKGKELNVYLLDYPVNRVLGSTVPFEFDSFSGRTIDNAIVVTRTAEMPRLLIHELIHFYEIIPPRDFERQYTEINNAFCLDHPENIFEAKTDALAVILNLFFYTQDKKELEELFLMEVLFSIQQSAKILRYTGFNSFEEFTNGCKKRMNYKVQYFSYLIVRSMLLFSNEKEFNKDITDIVLKTMKDTEFKQIINYYMKKDTGNYIGYNLIDY